MKGIPRNAVARDEAKSTLDELRSQPMFKIVVQKVDKNARNSIDPVPVGVNGVMYALRRGIPMWVPASVKEVLDHAVETEYETVFQPNPNGIGDTRVQVAREILSYPYQYIDGPKDRKDVPVDELNA